jgi:hypothetical protein
VEKQMTQTALPMINFIIGMVCWAALLAAAWPYVKTVKDAREPTLGAYLAFFSIFTVVAAALYSSAVAVVTSFGWATSMSGWFAAFALIAFAFVPAFLAATAYVRYPMPESEVPQ